MVSIRTIPRLTEVLFAILVIMPFVVGPALLIASLATSFLPLGIAGLVFVSIGIYEARRSLFRTASELAIDRNLGIVKWRSTASGGSVAVSMIERIERTPNRPSVYRLRCEDGSEVNCWLMLRDESVRTFFDTLQIENPLISTGELYEHGRLLWRGLPSPEG